jgi:hypothetical protein
LLSYIGPVGRTQICRELYFSVLFLYIYVCTRYTGKLKVNNKKFQGTNIEKALFVAILCFRLKYIQFL